MVLFNASNDIRIIFPKISLIEITSFLHGSLAIDNLKISEIIMKTNAQFIFRLENLTSLQKRSPPFCITVHTYISCGTNTPLYQCVGYRFQRPVRHRRVATQVHVPVQRGTVHRREEENAESTV